ncbi:hypothetical protein [Acinetobacter sp. ANC 3813]|uniref:hypothetical protein n=1 Tax=Acinetobacter sp. ANC 3813 TaxID=1977873 RepID=UPI000A35B7AE|nr:hypothetical protein [Acinetobacter sp. ANC 3813]OTG91806.1 hypothetical protein B9T34_00170 [Acinetobacter sp. ANC 3813]
MNSEEIAELFKLDDVDFDQCGSAEEYELKLLKQADNFFFDNYFKNEEILFFAFDFYYSIKLLENNENLKILKNILKNNKILEYFKENNFGIMELVLIITAFDKSTDYYIFTIKNQEKNQDKKIQEIYKKYINFINSTEDTYDFRIWYKNQIELLTSNLFLGLRARLIKNEDQMKICENITLNNKSIENISDLEYIFSKYIQDLSYPMISQKELKENEKNKKENKFIRDLDNMFNSLTNNRISYNFISELVSIIYNKQMNESQIKKVIYDGSISTSITQYKKKYIHDRDHNIIAMEIIRDNDFHI